MKQRGSGILLHITSLPSPFGIGDMGPGAYRFADFLADTKQRYWQILPLNPIDPIHCSSPYQSHSAFAYNPLLISPEILVRDGLLQEAELTPSPCFSGYRVDFPAVVKFKQKLLEQAYEKFKRQSGKDDYLTFCAENKYWLEDFSLFMALKSHFRGKVWTEWPLELRDKKPEAVQAAYNDLNDRVEAEKFYQYLFLRQWNALKHYCNHKGLEIIGDVPIFVDHDSVDVWNHPEFFKLDEEKQPRVVAGVPPDYFSKTGQRWGNPLYQWEELKLKNYDWWFQRLTHSWKTHDWIRVDHFRGFVASWEIAVTEKTAIKGSWVNAPAMDFFNQMKEQFPRLPIIAEDLGFITPDVREVMDHFGFPGMRVLLFAFGGEVATNPHAPHNHRKNCLVYTGTHDNNTTRGWFENEVANDEKEQFFRYLGKEVTSNEVSWELIRLGMMSVANTALFPLQDILGLGEKSRMNLPARKEGNWQWRLLPEQLTASISSHLLEMTKLYGRAQ